MKPSEISQALTICVTAKQPVVVWGAPGIGKSSLGQALAIALTRKLFDVRAALLDAVDLRGIPAVVKGKTVWCPPSFLPTDADGPSILLLDELNRAPGMVQNALLQLVLDRKLGEYTLPDDCEIISCCNRESDGGGVQKMHLALANRFEHLDMEPDLNDWCKWASAAGIHPMTIAHLRLRPERLFAMENWIGGRADCKHSGGHTCSCGAEISALPAPFLRRDRGSSSLASPTRTRRTVSPTPCSPALWAKRMRWIQRHAAALPRAAIRGRDHHEPQQVHRPRQPRRYVRSRSGVGSADHRE